MKKGGKFNIIDWLFILIAVVTAIIVLITDREHPLFYVIADVIAIITAVFCMVLGIKGYRSNFIFSIITTLAFAYIAWHNQFYGNVAISVFYYVPCALVGYYLWGKHSNKKREVIARKLTPAQFSLLIVAMIAAIVTLKLVLDAVGGTSTILDSVTVIITFMANILVLLRYREQWLLWLLGDTFQLIMWASTNDPVMLVLRILYPLSAIYGYIYWKKLVKKPSHRRKS
ncbi:nicotinamide mononucleotide transporter [Candidatus Saccharibacteria bacterium]|nr:nicotinamide mononucleotide transporter [Candidatus Saccharibacteria bacterium]